MLLKNVPASHELQEGEPGSAAYVPEAQVVQLGAPAFEYVPAGQVAQAAAPTSEKLPAGQVSLQTVVRPVVLE